MSTPTLESPPRKLQRDLDNRRIGGVCSGIARYFGVSVTLVRVLFLLSIFFSFSFTFWLYLVLWALLPARRSPAAGLSWRLRRKVRRLDRLVDATRERLSLPDTRLRLEHVQQLIHTLLPDFDRRIRAHDPEMAEIRRGAVEDLPELLDRYMTLPYDYAVGHPLESGETPEEQLGGKLARLEESLRQAAERRYREKVAASVDNPAAPRAPMNKLEAVLRRSAGRLDAAAEEKIARIKGALAAALSRLEAQADPTDPNLYNVRQIALEYLPDALEKYLALPPGWADSEPLQDGKTARDVLHDQLDLLDSTLSKLLASLYRDDAQGLLVHGRFLREKFVDRHMESMK